MEVPEPVTTNEDTVFTPNANLLPPSLPTDHPNPVQNDHHDHDNHGSHESSTPHKKIENLADLKPVPLEPMLRFPTRKRKESIAYSVISAVSLIYEDLARGAELAK